MKRDDTLYSMLPPDGEFKASGSAIEIFLNRHMTGSMPPHGHPHFELIYIIKGNRTVILDERKYKAGSGDLLVFHPNSIHEETTTSRKFSYVVMRFSNEALRKANLRFPPLDRTGPVISLPNRESFVELFQRMLKEKSSPDEGSDLLVGAYLVEFIVMLRRAVNSAITAGDQEDAPRSARIRTAIGTIQEDLTRDINLEQLARSSFMSKSHFSHVFKEETGETPKGFLIKERIQKAKEFLATTDKSAQEIAGILGYESPYFFYRQFKQKTGMTTAGYREKNGKR